MVPVIFFSQFGDTLHIPDGRNHLILGLNENFKVDLAKLNQYTNTISYNNYNIDIILATLNLKERSKSDIPIFSYQSEILGNYFHLSDFINYTLVVSADNRVSFFDYQLPKPHEISLLISKY